VTPPPRRDLDESLRDPVEQHERRDVESTAHTLTGEKSELTGSLRIIPFARLIQRLYARRSTGSLLLLRGGAKKIVSFVEGYPVAVRSNLLSECLGQILLSQKTISNEALAESIKRMHKEKRRQGEILVEMGALSPYNLTRALNEQVEAKLFEIFTWRDGQFMFKQGDPAPKGATRLARPPAALILEGIRRYYDSARQVAVLDAFAGSYVGLSSNPMLRMQEISTDPTELSFIHGISGHERLEDLLNRAEIPRDKAALFLVALSEAGVIAPTSSPTPAPSARGGAAWPGGRRRDALASTPAQGSDNGGEIEVSSADVIGDLDIVQLPDVDDAALADIAVEPVGGGVGSATPLGSGALSMVAQTVRTQDYFWALGVERSATSEDINRAYEALARTFHADGYRNSPDEDRKLAQEIFDRLSEAHAVLRDPDQRRTYAARVDGGEAGLPAPRLDGGTGTTPPAASGSATTAGNAAAHALYESGLEHLQAHRHHEAVEVFRQAARLVPGAADFRAALGWSLFREAPADARAGRAALAELRRAIQIDSRNLRALHYLANYYAETGQPDLAIDELERILQVDALDGDAIDQLRRLRDR
jgi:tetratricopeptide (TPR) repeat protein